MYKQYLCCLSFYVTNLKCLLEPAALVVHIKPPHQVLNIGQEATFNCNVTGYPIHTITWKKDQRQLIASSRVRLLSKDVLHITSVRREDRGMYQCFVYNDLDSAQGVAELKISGNILISHIACISLITY